jgi:hypothetical protein
MSKWAIGGIAAVVIGAVMLLFRKIGGLMGSGSREPLAIVDLVDPESLNWIDSVTFLSINNLLDTIVLAPIYTLLFIIGAVLLVISGFKK